MPSFIHEYGLFLAQTVTLVVAILVVVIGIIVVASRGRSAHRLKIEVNSLNDKYNFLEDTLKSVILSEEALRLDEKEEKAKEKKEKKEAKARKKKGEDAEPARKRVFVLDFDGDIRASGVDTLRDEISAVLTMAKEEDEVVLRLESEGGMVHTYGLAASQLARFKQQKIPLTVAVDKVAASGGYMMACVANQIIAAPFAVMGSIGVIAQIPNFHRVLKKYDVDYEQVTAGEYKRTLTMFGKNSDKSRKKFQQEIEETHDLFKAFIAEHRAQVNIDEVATGEHWYASQALKIKLVDQLTTSDDYLMAACKDADVYEINLIGHQTLSEKISNVFSSTLEQLFHSVRKHIGLPIAGI